MRIEVAKRGCCVRMAPAFLSLATPVALIPSVCRVSVSGASVVKYLVAPVYIMFPVKLECPASIIRLPIPILKLELIAILMPEKAAL